MKSLKEQNKNMSTNTGPDVIMMLNDLKESRQVKNRRENWNELNEMYKLSAKQDSDISEPPDEKSEIEIDSAYYSNKKINKINRRGTRSMNNFAHVLDNINRKTSEKASN